jgi:hypothetical protein
LWVSVFEKVSHVLQSGGILMFNIIRVIGLLSMLSFLTACMDGGQMASSPNAGGQKWVGVFIPMQSPLVDQKTAGRNADQYFMDIWNSYEAGRVQGAVADVHVFLWTGDHIETIYRGQVSGHQYFPVSRASVSSDTLLCVEVPWAIIAHQRVAAGDRVMCEAGTDAWFRQGRGNTADDAWGIIAIAPAGMPDGL